MIFLGQIGKLSTKFHSCLRMLKPPVLSCICDALVISDLQ